MMNPLPMRRNLRFIAFALGAVALTYFSKDQSIDNQKAHQSRTLSKKDNPTSTPYQDWLEKKIARKKLGIVKADEPEMHGIIQRQLRTRDGDDGPKYGPNQVMEEFMAARKRSKSDLARTESTNFIERGPGNIG